MKLNCVKTCKRKCLSITFSMSFCGYIRLFKVVCLIAISLKFMQEKAYSYLIYIHNIHILTISCVSSSC